MTNSEYIEAQIGFTVSNTNVIDAALIDAGITGTDTYVTASMLSLKVAAISVLYMILSTPDTVTGQGETANSIKYDRSAILNRINVLEVETNKVANPAIRGVKVW